MVKRWPRPRAENPQLPAHKPRVTSWTEAAFHPTVVELVVERRGETAQVPPGRSSSASRKLSSKSAAFVLLPLMRGQHLVQWSAKDCPPLAAVTSCGLPLEGGEDRLESVHLTAVRRERHQDRGGDAGVAPLLDPFADACRRTVQSAIR